ncbi:MAG: hypothetical protein JWO40_12 [Candidatus Doudnabacteria bacterium]|nr:hypothetical protein [Candidatus Doudnabacteria bacterium]
MIHENNRSYFFTDAAGHLYPAYGQYSVAEIVPTFLRWFGIDTKRAAFPEQISKHYLPKSQKLILFMLDGFGYDYFFKNYAEMEFFKRIVERGNVYPITSTFPSTTPAALTTIHTGLTPQEHGLLEWTVYFEELDQLIETLPFRPHHDHGRDSLLSQGGTGEMLYNGDTVYERLALHGVKCFSFIQEEISSGAYSKMVKKGSTVIEFVDEKDLMQKLTEKLENESGPAYYFVYWTKIDSVQHQYGTGSKEHHAEVQKFSKVLMQDFVEKINFEKSDDALLTFTADHGLASIRDEEIIYLNNFEFLEERYQKNKKGQRIPPTGSPHDVFLFIKPDKVEEVIEFLRATLGDRAEVLSSAEALRRGLFGLNDPAVKFLRRIGNVMILPREGFHVWYQYFQDYEFNQLGIHGGMSPQEMTSLFGVISLKTLKANDYDQK